MKVNKDLVKRLQDATDQAKKALDECVEKVRKAEDDYLKTHPNATRGRDVPCEAESSRYAALVQALNAASNGYDPDFFEKGSQKLAERLQDISDAVGDLLPLIAVGTAISMGEMIGIGGQHLPETVHAMEGIPKIASNQMKEDIKLFLVTGRPNQQERKFWDSVLKALGDSD